MNIVGNIVTFILTIISMIGLFWIIVGVPAGIVLVILKALKKIQLSGKRILLITLGGFMLLIITFILFFLLSLVFAFFGIPLTQMSLPKTP